MTPEMWTMIAIGLVIVGLVLRGQTAARQDARDNRAEIAALRNDMNAEFKGFRAEMNARFDKQGDRIDALRADIAGLGERLSRVEGIIETLTGRRDAA